ncbi:MAG: ASKHA domain-containing protein [Anaerolineae bacterium]|nr:MAG: ASKHA domain-containing protein [Anaerolineae bacterium]
MTEKEKHLVIFQPSGSRGEVEDGMTILEAGRTLGVDIETPCGGRLTCSKCRVQIEEGFFERFGIESSMDHLNPVLEREQSFFRSKGLTDPNLRQSCAAEIHGPIVVYVPEESRAVKQLVRKSAREVNIEIKPALQRYFVEMSPATLHDPLGDWERLKIALEAEHGLTNLTIDYLTLSGLQKTVRDGDWKVSVFVWNGSSEDAGGEVIRVLPGFAEFLIGLAVDVGTTTVAGFLCDLESGRVLASHSMMNPQTPYGDDVMARITYAMTNDDGLEKMHTAILDGLNTIVQQVCEVSGFEQEDILEAVLVGNTCMDHIFLNIEPRYVGVSPFSPAIHHSLDIKARDFGLQVNPSANIHVLPNEAGFVGADNVAVIIAEEPYKQDEMMLVIDIGTNGEMVLGNRHKLISTSVPTGPAFEGAQISNGMRAAVGAIENVVIDPITWDVRFRVIGQEEWSDKLPPDAIQARGLCGSAMIDLGWELYRSGVINASGRFSRETHSTRLREGANGIEFVIAWAEQTSIGRDITFNLDDVRALQLAKAAMYSAAKIMMRRMNVSQVDKIVLAGAFGSYINKVKAMAMGLIPDCQLDNVYAVGNAAGDGARMALLNTDKRAEANQMARQVDYIELTVEPDFEKQFATAMHFPHMKDKFPHLQKMIDKAERDRFLRLLRNLPAFDGLPNAALRPLAAALDEVRFRKNKTIFEEGSQSSMFHIVKEGGVRLTSNLDGQVMNTYDVGPGDIFNGREVLEGLPNSATATATELNTRVLLIPGELVRAMVEKAPEVGARLLDGNQGKGD